MLAGSPAELQVRSMAKAQRRERQRRAKAHAAQDKDKDYEDMSVVPPFPIFYIGDPGTEDQSCQTCWTIPPESEDAGERKLDGENARDEINAENGTGGGDRDRLASGGNTLEHYVSDLQDLQLKIAAQLRALWLAVQEAEHEESEHQSELEWWSTLSPEEARQIADEDLALLESCFHASFELMD